MLNQREIEILEYARLGLRQAEIGEQVGLTHRQVHRSLSRIRKRSGARTVQEVVALAVADGYLAPPGDD